jgi:penicillin-binding protein-related factor A (putative recombinase)
MTGKDFENKIKQACDEQGILSVRLRDAGYQGEMTSQRRFTIKNICDYILFNDRMFVAMEAKHRKQSLAFKDITQAKDMTKLNNFIENNGILSATCGLLVCFGDIEKTYWVHISAIEELKAVTGKKSFNAKDCHSMALEHPMLVMKVHTITPPRKKIARLDMSFLGAVI